MDMLKRVGPRLPGSGALQPLAKGTWRLREYHGQQWVLASCPKCGGDLAIRRLDAPTPSCAEIGADGVLSRRYVCPYAGCGYASFLCLDGWDPRDERGNRPIG